MEEMSWQDCEVRRRRSLEDIVMKTELRNPMDNCNSLVNYLILDSLMSRRNRRSRNCPYCGYAVEPGWKVCPICGNEIPDTGQDSSDDYRNGMAIAVAVFLGVVLVGMIVAIVLLL